MAEILSFDNKRVKGDNLLKKAWESFLSQPIYVKFAVISFFLVSLVTPAIINNYQVYRSRAQEAPKTVTWKTYDDSVKENKIKPAEKILEISLIYNAKETPVLKISGLRKLNGYSPKYPKVENGYTLNILNEQRNTVDSISFKIPNERVFSPPLASESATEKGPIILDQLEFALTLAWTQEAKEIQVIDPNGQTIITETVSKAVNVDNKPNFKSIRGDELLNAKKSSSNFLEPKPALAATSDNTYLDIVFIGDDYSDFNTFHNHINNFVYGSNGLLVIEPFISRASQLRFSHVDNTSDLGCWWFNSRRPVCNDTKVIEAVNNAGVPYDLIVVLYYYSTRYSEGTALLDGPIAVVSTQDLEQEMSPRLFVHELSHTLGLVDEYVSYSSNRPTDRNCYNGTPPNPAWAGIVDPSSYYMGCEMETWYRSSENSIMNDFSSAFYFNPISKKILNQRIDFYTRGGGGGTGCYQFKCTQSIPPNSTCADSGPATRNTADCTNQWCVNNDPVGSIYCDEGATCTANPANCDVPTPTPGAPACDPSQVNMSFSPNPGVVGGNITFSTSGNQGSTLLGDAWSGGVNCSGGFWGTKTCAATVNGSFNWTHTWKNCATNNCNITSPQCSKTISYSVTAPTGSINGTVRKLPDNALLPGVTVTLVGTTRTTTTNTTGAWAMTNVPSGLRTFSFAKAGFATKTASVTIPVGSGVSLHIQLSPISEGSINGTVRNFVNNALLPGVTVSLVSPARTTTTDANGTWFMSNVPSGSRQFTFSKSGFVSKTVTVTIPTGQSLSYHVQLTPTTPIPTPTPTMPSSTIVGLKGVYYKDLSFTTIGTTTIGEAINFNWGANSPYPGVIPTDNFTVRWTGFIKPPYTGTYTFYTTTDDGVNLWINNQLLIKAWKYQSPTEYSVSVNLTAGVRYPIRMDYFEGTGGAVAQLRWSGPNIAKQIIKTDYFTPN